MEKKKYDILAVIKRMLLNVKKQDKKQFLRVAVYTVAATAYPFLAVFLPKIAIGILEQNGENAARDLAAAMVLYAVVAGVLGYIMKYMDQVIQIHNMCYRLRNLTDVTDKVMTMDYHYVEDSKFYEENDRAFASLNGNALGMEGVYNKLYLMPAALLSILGMIALTGYLSPWIMLALLLHVGVIMWISRQNHNYRYARKEEVAKAERKIRYYYKTTHDFSYGKDIRIYNFRDRILKNYKEEIDALTRLTGKMAGHEFLLGMAGIVTLTITNVVMYGILVYRAYMGMPISSFTMYISLIMSLMQMMLTFGENVAFIWNEGQYVNDFYNLMDADLKNEGGTAGKPQGTLEIVFDHVSFHYPNSEKEVFHDLNFTIHKGESVAVVGVNGAGKSTLVKLMTGLFEPTKGHIYINGVEIREYRKKDLYDLYAAVFQDVNILAFTIRENVACRAEQVDDARIEEALDKVGLGDKVRGFEKGLDQMMLKVIDENGTDFSGGERQKLSIARGLYKDAPMVIMDEPTAALDALAEEKIYKSFSDMVKGKTALYISHRLASTKFCDKIALFDADGLKEYGTHEELMEKKGAYYKMFVIQGKYYQEQNDTTTNVERG